MLAKSVRSFIYLFVTILLLGVNVLLVGDSIGKSSFVISRLMLDPLWIFLSVIVFLLILKISKHIAYPKIFFNTYIYILIPISTLLAVFFTWLELSNYYNYVYSNYFIFFESLTIWSFSCWVTGLILMPEVVFKKNWRNILFWMPVVLLIALGVIWTWPQDVFLQLVKEDREIETLQAGILIAGAFAAVYLSGKLFKKSIIKAAVFFLVAMILFFVAGDEVSWGQRFLGFETPVSLAEDNIQSEATLHNLDGIHQLVGYGYILIGLFGSFAWIMKDLFLGKKKLWVDIFIPGSYLFFFFYLCLVYNAYALGEVNQFGEWSEVAELLLYMGISTFLITESIHSKVRKV